IRGSGLHHACGLLAVQTAPILEAHVHLRSLKYPFVLIDAFASDLDAGIVLLEPDLTRQLKVPIASVAAQVSIEIEFCVACGAGNLRGSDRPVGIEPVPILSLESLSRAHRPRWPDPKIAILAASGVWQQAHLSGCP